MGAGVGRNHGRCCSIPGCGAVQRHWCPAGMTSSLDLLTVATENNVA